MINNGKGYMGGTISGPFDNGMAQTITTGGALQNCTIDYWPYDQRQNYFNQFYIRREPAECSAGVHVFPCPHCDKCKCGKATVKRDKRK